MPIVQEKGVINMTKIWLLVGITQKKESPAGNSAC